MEKGKKQKKQDENRNKQISRILDIYDRMNVGEKLSKKSLAEEYKVHTKTIGRDFDCLEEHYEKKCKLSGKQEVMQKEDARQRFYLDNSLISGFTMEEILALNLILLSSRAFRADEKELLLSKLLSQVSDSQRTVIEKTIANERLNYTPLTHGKELLPSISILTKAIREQNILEIRYKRMDGEEKTHRVKPVALMFEIYYFYLHAYMANNSKEDTTIFRLDRIQSIVDTKEKFRVNTGADRFQEGEFRKNVQFMFSGKSKHVKFIYQGQSIEAVKDYLPQAKIEALPDGRYLVRAVIQGEGAKMWLRSQGKWIEMVEEEGEK